MTTKHARSLDRIRASLAALPDSATAEEVQRRLEIERLLREEKHAARPVLLRASSWAVIAPIALTVATFATQLMTDYYVNMSRLASLELAAAKAGAEKADKERVAAEREQKAASDATAAAKYEQEAAKVVSKKALDQKAEADRALEIANQTVREIQLKQAELNSVLSNIGEKLLEEKGKAMAERVLAGATNFNNAWPWQPEALDLTRFLRDLQQPAIDQLLSSMQAVPASTFRRCVFMFCVYQATGRAADREQAMKFAEEVAHGKGPGGTIEVQTLFGDVLTPVARSIPSNGVKNVARPDWPESDRALLRDFMREELHRAIQEKDLDRGNAILTYFHSNERERLGADLAELRRTAPSAYESFLDDVRRIANATPESEGRRTVFGSAFTALYVADVQLFLTIASRFLEQGEDRQLGDSYFHDTVEQVIWMVDDAIRRGLVAKLDPPSDFAVLGWKRWRANHRGLVTYAATGSIADWMAMIAPFEEAATSESGK